MHASPPPIVPPRRQDLLSTCASLRRLGVPLVIGALMAGCASGPPKPPILSASVVASVQVNPDSRKRASPIVVRVFELKSSAVFESADFVSLFEKDQAVLGAEMLGREEMVLRPGETRKLDKTLPPGTRFIGVMAAFRELERARWSAIVPVVAGKKNVVAITLDGIAVKAERSKP